MDISITVPMKAGRQLEPTTMKVWAKVEEISKVLKHPVGGGFTWPDPADWPDDTFTFRQVQAGDVLLRDPALRHSSRRTSCMLLDKKVMPKAKE